LFPSHISTSSKHTEKLPKSAATGNFVGPPCDRPTSKTCLPPFPAVGTADSGYQVELADLRSSSPRLETTFTRINMDIIKIKPKSKGSQGLSVCVSEAVIAEATDRNYDADKECFSNESALERLKGEDDDEKVELYRSKSMKIVHLPCVVE